MLDNHSAEQVDLEKQALRRRLVAEARARFGDERIDDLAELLLEVAMKINDEARMNAAMDFFKAELGVQAASDLFFSVAIENSGLR